VDKFNIFLLFSEDVHHLIHDSGAMETYLLHLARTIDRADCENGSVVFTDSANCQRFLDGVEALGDMIGYLGTVSTVEAIYVLLNDIEVTHWTDSPQHDLQEVNVYYRLFDPPSRSLSQTSIPTVHEAAERKFRIVHAEKEDVLVINFHPQQVDFSTIIRGQRTERPVLINVDVVNDFKSLEDWLYKRIKKRKYNDTDNRHVETSREYLTGKSPILGGQSGKSELATLLPRAIGDKKVRKYLANINADGIYVRYEYEGETPQNGFHGYHLIRPESHAVDFKAINDLPDRVKALLDFRQQISAV